MNKTEQELFMQQLRSHGVYAALVVGLRFARRKASKTAAWEVLRQMKEHESALPVIEGQRGWPDFAAVQLFLDAQDARPSPSDSETQQFINLTPHYIDLPGWSIKPSGIVARLEVTYMPTGVRHAGVPIETKTMGVTVGLPEPSPGVMYIVSDVVRLANANRFDICSPGRQRTRAGYKNGCASLVVNPPHRFEEEK